MGDVAWVLLFYSAGIVAMLIELLIPGAVMGVLGFLAVCGSVVYAYMTGHTVLATVLVGTTIAFIPLFFAIWKNVLGKFLALGESEKDFRPSTMPHEELLGKEGQATSPLRPSGVAMIEGQRHTVITRGEMVERGARVKVIDVSGNRVTVKRV